jgi:RNA polymerase sigma-70 factor, ECF subfamily
MNERARQSSGPARGSSGSGEVFKAFIRAMEKGRAPLIRVAYRTTRNMEEAEDVVQEAFMKAFVCLHQFRGEARVDTWLRTIVVNTARNWARRRRGYVPVPLEHPSPGDAEPLPLEIADKRRNPEQWCEYGELETKLMGAVDQLGKRYEAVVRMCVLGECSYLEASSVLNLSLVTVRARVFRGRQILRRHLRQTIRDGASRGLLHSERRITL